MPESTSSIRGPRWLALAVLCTGALMIILDGTIVAVALPTIQRELGFSQANLAWVVNAYLIAFAGLLLLSGRIGDLVGRKQVFIAGLVVFIVASLVCGLSTNQTTLIVARFVQGVGGALGSSVILGMIVTMYTEPGEQAQAIGVYSFVSAAGASIGLLAGGFLTQGISWHWIFFINIPIGGAAALLGLWLFASDKGIGLGEGADVIGALLVTGGLMLLVYTIVQATDGGWASGRTIGLLAGSIVLLVAFVVRQGTAAKPLMPLRIFRSRPLSGANVIVLLMVAGLIGFQFLTALFLQRVQLYGAITTGLAFLPTPLLIAAVSLGLSARLIGRFGPSTVLLAGLVLIAVALALAARVPVDARYPVDILPVMLLIGVGFGAAMPALIGQAMSAATPADSGLASGLVNTTQQVGGAVGLAVLATLATSRTNGLLASGRSAADALTSGYHLAYGTAAGFVVAAFVVAAVVLPRRGTAGERSAVEPTPASSQS